MRRFIIAAALASALTGCVTIPKPETEAVVCDDAKSPDCGDDVIVEVE